MAAAAPAYAQAEDIDFNIPPQSLSAALDTFAAQSRQAILVTPEMTADKTSQGVAGTVDTGAALSRLLDGTGLTWRVSGKTFLIVQGGSADPQSASAGGDVDALIVTAQKREENIQDVPIAISAFSQEDLTRSQIAGGPDLMTQVPNFTFTKTNFSSYSIQIRGIGTQAISATTDPAVAIAFNNTPFVRNRFFEQEFYDLQRVEVLRGPQGTLYGRNATAGVVNIISAKPKYVYEAKASADVSNYGSSRIEGMINMPLFEDKAALRIAGAWTKRDGYVKNILTGEQIDGRDLWSTRISLRLEPVDWMSADLIYEHFEENDDRLRSGKQLCHKDVGPTSVNGVELAQSMSYPLYSNLIGYFTQGCLPASMYSPDSYQTPNGFALPYGPAAQLIGSPVADVDTYESAFQSRNLREIETRLTPEYTASTDVVELQLQFDLPHNLTLASETGFARDRLYSFQDFNRFSTRANTITTPSGEVCNAQIGCSDRMQAGDLSTARSQHFSQEFRLSSDYEGRFNFSLGANFLRYDTEDKYYVFINTLSAVAEVQPDFVWCDPSLNGNNGCYGQFNTGYQWSDSTRGYGLGGFAYIYPDLNDIHHLNDLGRNYFLSKNPYGLMSYAGFGEAYFDITDNLRITAGARWTVDRKTAPQIPSWLLAGYSYGLPTRKTIELEWEEPTGRVAIDWKPDLSFTDETLVYGSYVHGYKAGGANPPPAILVFAPVSCAVCNSDLEVAESLTHPETFEPEFVDAYEIGTKNTLLDGRLTFNINAFYYDYTGYQISQIVDRSAVNLNFDAKIWGSEIEIDWRPLDNLRLGFKGGYENTRMAEGSEAIDLMDRTAGTPGWIIHKPFPTAPSNCILPVEYAFWENRGPLLCSLYKVEVGSPGTIPWDAPNNGEGFTKDLSGNELPNAPDFTATITADYTLPLPNDWLVTLHTDLYYQSEAWTRIFNTEGYDKLKAYNNINFAAIFTNEDAGWTVMAYVKNVLDKSNITGAFLNSDDTGLTTNVFLNEPRLYGLRVTKTWTGSDWWSARANKSGHYPYRLEVFGDYGHFSGGREIFAPATTALFPADHPYPLDIQNNLDWGSAGGVKTIWQPENDGWFISGAVRYGRVTGYAEEHPKWAGQGGYVLPEDNKYVQYFAEQGENLHIYLELCEQEDVCNYATATSRNEESHTIVDFAVGRDFGLGAWRAGAESKLSLGLQYAHLRSASDAELHGRPDISMDEEAYKYEGISWHRFWGQLDADREFQGGGPALSWETSFPIVGNETRNGRIDADVGLGGSVLWGKQDADISGMVRGDYHTGHRQGAKYGPGITTHDAYNTPFEYHRSKRVVVPSVNANLGVSYTLGGLKVSGGYRVERFFDAIDAGIAERKTFDRQYDGPYFKVSFGFGG